MKQFLPPRSRFWFSTQMSRNVLPLVITPTEHRNGAAVINNTEQTGAINDQS
ncbi:hypothetical protein IVA87_24875 [Bradyrhizobium sp. 147]|uniref:hypothetical protein n=1 Tax=Bradyrhizobium sp. 147 TaxID=2782623 RepID=UPI001FF8B1C9|nr:hypothetical protein [Bradyrhizobium sp. 147]MCK1682554.1 hypothetical protein [Bradyrhizobium sp. 147]